MSYVQYFLGIFAALLTVVLVVEMLRRRKLRERHAIWWLVLGISALIVSIFPKLLENAANFLGFEIPINLVFFTSLFVLFLVALQHRTELTKLENQNRSIVERLVLLELKVDDFQQTHTANCENGQNSEMGFTSE